MNECVLCSREDRSVAAEIGSVCSGCSNRLLRTLTDVELCVLAISAVPAVHGLSATRGAPGFGSRSPANDSAIVHTDHRSAWTEEDGHGAFAMLHSWAELVRSELDLRGPNVVTVTTEARTIRMAHRHVVDQSWVSSYWEELKGAQRAVQRLIGLSPDRPLGPCRSAGCNGRAFPFEDGAKCRKCDRLYRGLSMAEIRHDRSVYEMDRIPSDLALRALREYGTPVSAATLRKWVQRGHISGGDGYDMLEILEYLNRRNDPSIPQTGELGR